MARLGRNFKPLMAAVVGWLVVGGAIAAIGSLGGALHTSADERAVDGLRAARNAMTEYRKLHHNFDGVTVAALRRLNHHVPANLDPPETLGAIYALGLTMPSGVNYRLGVGQDERETHECTVPPGVSPGVCRMAAGDTTGTW